MGNLPATAEKPKATIFYSWQSDLPNATNRGFIRGCLDKAIKDLGQVEALRVVPRVQQDTQDVPGSPSIAGTIFEKIEDCDVFVGDVSIINSDDKRPGTGKPTRLTPNPNVLLELGFAAKCHSWNRVLCIANVAYAEVEKLPFDLRGRRILPYSLVKDEDKNDARRQLVAQLTTRLIEIFSLSSPSTDPMVDVFFADPESEQRLGDTAAIKSRVFEKIKPSSLPDYGQAAQSVTIGGSKMYLPSLSTFNMNKDFYRDFSEYYTAALATQAVVIGITNNGAKVLHDVRLVFEIPNTDGVLFLEKMPPDPQDKSDILGRHIPAMPSFGPRSVGVKNRKFDTVLTLTFGKMQIGETDFSDTFRIGLTSPPSVELRGWLYADELPPQAVALKLEGDVVFTSQTTDELVNKAHEWLDYVEAQAKQNSSEDSDD